MDYTSIIIDIRKLVRAINLESKKIQKDFGISIPQLLTLTHLSKKEEYRGTHKELTDYLNLNSSTVTGIVNRLESRGLVARLPKKGDKRVTNIALTSTGYQLLENAPDLLHEKLAKKLALLPKEEFETIQQTLGKLVHVLGIEEMDASPLIVGDDSLSGEN